eukprot:snap_masked-scaffold_14-processed-gene-4.17-mRNA-1 protein AED:1.00 eAED:1.00 QI:0/-1/0/0/-1/1/1/0/286
MGCKEEILDKEILFETFECAWFDEGVNVFTCEGDLCNDPPPRTKCNAEKSRYYSEINPEDSSSAEEIQESDCSVDTFELMRHNLFREGSLDFNNGDVDLRDSCVIFSESEFNSNFEVFQANFLSLSLQQKEPEFCEENRTSIKGLQRFFEENKFLSIIFGGTVFSILSLFIVLKISASKSRTTIDRLENGLDDDEDDFIPPSPKGKRRASSLKDNAASRLVNFFRKDENGEPVSTVSTNHVGGLEEITRSGKKKVDYSSNSLDDLMSYELEPPATEETYQLKNISL